MFIRHLIHRFLFEIQCLEALIYHKSFWFDHFYQRSLLYYWFSECFIPASAPWKRHSHFRHGAPRREDLNRTNVKDLTQRRKSTSSWGGKLSMGSFLFPWPSRPATETFTNYITAPTRPGLSLCWISRSTEGSKSVRYRSTTWRGCAGHFLTRTKRVCIKVWWLTSTQGKHKQK